MKKVALGLVIILMLLQVQGCADIFDVEDEFVTLLQSLDRKVYLNVYNLSDGKLAYSKKLGKIDQYFWAACDFGDGYNLVSTNANEVLRITAEGIVSLGKLDRNIVYAAEYKEDIIAVNYDCSQNLFVSKYSADNFGTPILEEELEGTFSDVFLDPGGKMVISTFGHGEIGTNLYKINLATGDVDRTKIFESPYLTRIAYHAKEYWIVVIAEVINDLTHREVNKLYTYKPDTDVVELTGFTKTPFDILCHGDCIYCLVDVNNPSLHVLGKSNGSSITVLELNEQVYGLKAIGNKIYLFGKKSLLTLENGKLKVLNQYKPDNLLINLDIY